MSDREIEFIDVFGVVEKFEGFNIIFYNNEFFTFWYGNENDEYVSGLRTITEAREWATIERNRLNRLNKRGN